MTPSNCYTTFARINTKLLDAVKSARQFIETPNGGDILKRVEKTQTRSVLPEGWVYK